MKINAQIIVLGACVAAGFGTARLEAQSPIEVDQRIQNLERAVKDVQSQNSALQQELEELKKSAPVSAPSPGAKPTDLRFFWKDGLRFETADGETFKGRIGGRIMWDTAFSSESDKLEAVTGNFPSGTEFRRVRLYTSGELGSVMPAYYKLQLDFAGGGTALKDVFLGVRKIPVIGKVQVGHFYEPFSLEQNTSSKYITFMERALPIEAFGLDRNAGVMVGNAHLEDRMTWAIGGFADVGDSGNAPFDSNYRVTGRLTGLPWHAEDGAKLLHLGVGGTFIEPQNELSRFRSRPEAHLAPRFVDTGMFGADTVWQASAEAALVHGPFSVQAEYIRSFVERPGLPGAQFDGCYVFGSWFITGEHRVYKKGDAVFDRVQPKSNFGFKGGGPGAWELALRYSQLDLDDAGISGGDLRDVTAGVNWHMNPNMRLMFNYVLADLSRRGVDAQSHIFMTRAQVDF